MATVAEILGEERAKRTWNGAFANAEKVLADAPLRTVIKRLIADHETETKAMMVLIGELQARIVRLEKQTNGVKYAGTWRHDTTFPEGSLTTHDGALWVACIESRGVHPGKNSGSCWKMVCKSYP